MERTALEIKKELHAARAAYRARVDDDPEVKALHDELAFAVQQAHAAGATRAELAAAIGTKDPYTLIDLLRTQL